MTKAKYLGYIEEAYRQVGQGVTTVGLYLTPPFNATRRGGELAEEIRDDLRAVEAKLSEMYRVESEVVRP